MINVEVSKNGSESNVSLLRRFTKRVQGSGILPRIRSERYALRKPSEYVKKKKALKTLRKRQTFEDLVKKGLATENTRGRK